MNEMSNSLKDAGPSLTTERPHFGSKQVRTLKGIKKGLILIAKTTNIEVKILDKPYHKAKGNWWVSVSKKFHGTWYPPLEISLADYGVVPYEFNGKWNKVNWLARL